MNDNKKRINNEQELFELFCDPDNIVLFKQKPYYETQRKKVFATNGLILIMMNPSMLSESYEEFEALNRQLDAEENDADAETKEEAREIHIRKSIYKSQKWETYLMVSKWNRSIRGASEGYKKRKAAKEENNQNPKQ